MKLKVFFATLFVGATVVLAQATQPTTQQTTGRSANQIIADFNVKSEKLNDMLHEAQTVSEEKGAAPAALPVLHDMIGLLQELRAADPSQGPAAESQIVELRTIEMIFGDASAQAIVAKAAAAGDSLASAQLAAIDFINASDDASHLKAVDAFDTVLKRNPTDDSLASILMLMVETGPAPAPAVTKQLLADVNNDAKSAAFEETAIELDTLNKMEAMLNKPLTLAENTSDGSPFSTAQWKGKVILVDFWASWCPPCVAELPAIKRIYAKYHAQGLEIVGISSDHGVDDLKKFLADNPDMPWPQLFDPGAVGLNKLATQFGIELIPQMFLIDRNGILRGVDGAHEMDELVPRLLAEKAR